MKKENKKKQFSLIVSRNYKIIEIDNDFAEILKYSSKDLEGNDVFKIIYPLDRDNIEELITTGEQKGCLCKIRFVTKTNSIITTKIKFFETQKNIHFSISLINLKLDNIEDIRWQLKLFRKSLNILNAGLMLTDNDGNIIFVSDSTEKVLRLVSKNIIGKNITYFISDKKLFDTVKKTDKKFFEGELNFIYNEINLFLRFFAEKFNDEKNNIHGYLLTFLDVSHIKKMQEEHTRVDKLASLGILASGIAHEIRNPLAGIKAMAQTIQEEVEPETETYDYIERIIKQVNRLDKILKVFFAYARPKATYKSKVNVKEVIEDISIMLKYNFQKKNIDFRTDFGENLPPLFVDPDQLQQILINLLLNAIDAVKENGKIEISVNKTQENFDNYSFSLKCLKEEAEGWILISIRDNGSGIPDEIKKKIFDPFFTTKTKGSGLGLSIVHQLVAENCGKLSFESEKGKGTTFNILLPYKE